MIKLRQLFQPFKSNKENSLTSENCLLIKIVLLFAYGRIDPYREQTWWAQLLSIRLRSKRPYQVWIQQEQARYVSSIDKAVALVIAQPRSHQKVKHVEVVLPFPRYSRVMSKKKSSSYIKIQRKRWICDGWSWFNSKHRRLILWICLWRFILLTHTNDNLLLSTHSALIWQCWDKSMQ